LTILQKHQLNDLLVEASSGRYVIAESHADKHVVLDTVTGHVRSFLVARLKQELFRPTPSDVLPGIDQSRIRGKPITSWDIAFRLYCDYVKEFISLCPPKGRIYKGFDLGLWCQHQRDDYKRGKLDYGRKKQLVEFGFCWDPVEDNWKRHYILLREYQAETGTYYIQASRSYKGVYLGQWLCRQRKLFENGTLSLSRRNQLLEIDRDIFRVPQRGRTRKQ